MIQQFHSWVFIYLKKAKALTWKETRTTRLTALFTILKTQKQPERPSAEGKDKENVVHTEALLSHNRNGILPLVTIWLNLVGIILKWSKLVRQRHTI